MIQQQCSERRPRTGRSSDEFLRNGTTIVKSDNDYGRFLRRQLETPQDVFVFSQRVRNWLRQHVQTLLDRMSAGDLLHFSGELFSSIEVPELSVWPEGMPSSLLRHFVAQGHALPASNPTALLRMLQRDPQLGPFLGDGAWIDTWTQIDGQGVIHLMYTLQWQKTAIGLAKAA